MMQVLLSRQEIDESTLGRWVSIQRYFHQLDLQAANINLPRTYQTTLQTLAEGETQASGDRFLESCYWEKASEFYYQHDYRNHYDEITQSLRLAIEKGYPAAHLYYKLGCLYLRKNRFKEAQQAFDAALVQDPQFEEALDAKRLLVGMKKQ
jgi:tetratricopeptide (TPR) repeat protein